MSHTKPAMFFPEVQIKVGGLKEMKETAIWGDQMCRTVGSNPPQNLLGSERDLTQETARDDWKMDSKTNVKSERDLAHGNRRTKMRDKCKKALKNWKELGDKT